MEGSRGEVELSLLGNAKVQRRGEPAANVRLKAVPYALEGCPVFSLRAGLLSDGGLGGFQKDGAHESLPLGRVEQIRTELMALHE